MNTNNTTTTFISINVGDKIVAKETTWIANEGKIGVVTKVENNLVSFEFEGNPKVNCMMDFETFNHYFAIAEVEKVEIPRVTEEMIDEILAESEFVTYTTFDKCTVVSCRLPNGFVITESSACVSPENYDEELGEKICCKKIKDKIWEMEAYLLQERLYEEWLCKDECCCDECDNCPCNDDDEETDCNNCSDYNCNFNPANHF